MSFDGRPKRSLRALTASNHELLAGTASAGINPTSWPSQVEAQADSHAAATTSGAAAATASAQAAIQPPVESLPGNRAADSRPGSSHLTAALVAVAASGAMPPLRRIPSIAPACVSVPIAARPLEMAPVARPAVGLTNVTTRGPATPTRHGAATTIEPPAGCALHGMTSATASAAAVAPGAPRNDGGSLPLAQPGQVRTVTATPAAGPGATLPEMSASDVSNQGAAATAGLMNRSLIRGASDDGRGGGCCVAHGHHVEGSGSGAGGVRQDPGSVLLAVLAASDSEDEYQQALHRRGGDGPAAAAHPAVCSWQQAPAGLPPPLTKQSLLPPGMLKSVGDKQYPLHQAPVGMHGTSAQQDGAAASAGGAGLRGRAHAQAPAAARPFSAAALLLTSSSSSSSSSSSDGAAVEGVGARSQGNGCEEDGQSGPAGLSEGRVGRLRQQQREVLSQPPAPGSHAGNSGTPGGDTPGTQRKRRLPLPPPGLMFLGLSGEQLLPPPPKPSMAAAPAAPLRTPGGRLRRRAAGQPGLEDLAVDVMASQRPAEAAAGGAEVPGAATAAGMATAVRSGWRGPADCAPQRALIVPGTTSCDGAGTLNQRDCGREEFRDEAVEEPDTAAVTAAAWHGVDAEACGEALSEELDPAAALELRCAGLEPHCPPLELKVPSSAARYLRDYQAAGVAFLFRQYAAGMGGLLADDMGLGKTLQAVAFLSAVLGHRPTDPPPPLPGAPGVRYPRVALVVAPASLLDNWRREFEMWSDLRVIPYNSRKNRREALADAAAGRVAAVLIGYELFRTHGHLLVDPGLAGSEEEEGGSDEEGGAVGVALVGRDDEEEDEEDQNEVEEIPGSGAEALLGRRQHKTGGHRRQCSSRGHLTRARARATGGGGRSHAAALDADAVGFYDWHCVVFDEVHRIKTRGSGLHIAAGRLRTKLRYGLSGTLMPNAYKELWAMLDWALPGCAGSRSTFEKRLAAPIRRGQQAGASEKAKQLASLRLAQLHSLLPALLLRRTKALIAAQMPRKYDRIVYCDLTPMQIRAYHRLLGSPDVQRLLRLLRADRQCTCGSADGSGDLDSSGGSQPAGGNGGAGGEAFRGGQGADSRGASVWECAKCYAQLVSELSSGVLWRQLHCCTCDQPAHPIFRPDGCRRHKPGGCDPSSRMRCPLCLVMPLLVLLRKVCQHLALLPPNPGAVRQHPAQAARDLQVARGLMGEDWPLLAAGSGAGAAEVATGVRGAATGLTGDRGGGGRWLSHSSLELSGKLAALHSLLRSWRPASASFGGGGDKVLLFSHSTQLLDLVQSYVVRQGYDFCRLDGSTPVSERQSLVDSFNQRPSAFLFLISTLAGGVGLNLTSANRVVVIDPSWNPAHDLQAQDRAYRLGQQRDVHVYRLVAAGTVEEVVYRRQLYKQQQSNVAVSGHQEARYFRGVQGVKGAEGELWGLENLLIAPPLNPPTAGARTAARPDGRGSLRPVFGKGGGGSCEHGRDSEEGGGGDDEDDEQVNRAGAGAGPESLRQLRMEELDPEMLQQLRAVPGVGGVAQADGARQPGRRGASAAVAAAAAAGGALASAFRGDLVDLALGVEDGEDGDGLGLADLAGRFINVERPPVAAVQPKRLAAAAAESSSSSSSSSSESESERTQDMVGEGMDADFRVEALLRNIVPHDQLLNRGAQTQVLPGPYDDVHVVEKEADSFPGLSTPNSKAKPLVPPAPQTTANPPATGPAHVSFQAQATATATTAAAQPATYEVCGMPKGVTVDRAHGFILVDLSVLGNLPELATVGAEAATYEPPWTLPCVVLPPEAGTSPGLRRKAAGSSRRGPRGPVSATLNNVAEQTAQGALRAAQQNYDDGGEVQSSDPITSGSDTGADPDGNLESDDMGRVTPPGWGAGRGKPCRQPQRWQRQAWWGSSGSAAADKAPVTAPSRKRSRGATHVGPHGDGGGDGDDGDDASGRRRMRRRVLSSGDGVGGEGRARLGFGAVSADIVQDEEGEEDAEVVVIEEYITTGAHDGRSTAATTNSGAERAAMAVVLLAAEYGMSTEELARVWLAAEEGSADRAAMLQQMNEGIALGSDNDGDAVRRVDRRPASEDPEEGGRLQEFALPEEGRAAWSL